MLNVTHTLDRMEISQTSVSRAINTVSDMIMSTEDHCKESSKFIKSLLSLDMSFTDPNLARLTAMAVIELVVKAKGEIDDEEVLLLSARDRAYTFFTDPKHQWMYAREVTVDTKETKAVATGIDVKVAVRADGTIGRGGKQVLALELFKKHVLESKTPLSNADFVKLLMKELQMTLPGARTYSHNLRKQNGMTK